MEIRRREILYEGAYWTMVADLRNGGHLDDGGHGQLLDRLHALGLLDDVSYRGGRNIPGSAAELPAQRVAEPRGRYQSELFRKDEQGKLFE